MDENCGLCEDEKDYTRTRKSNLYQPVASLRRLKEKENSKLLSNKRTSILIVSFIFLSQQYLKSCNVNLIEELNWSIYLWHLIEAVSARVCPFRTRSTIWKCLIFITIILFIYTYIWYECNISFLNLPPGTNDVVTNEKVVFLFLVGLMYFSH